MEEALNFLNQEPLLWLVTNPPDPRALTYNGISFATSDFHCLHGRFPEHVKVRLCSEYAAVIRKKMNE